MPPLPQVLAELPPGLARLAAPVVKQMAQRLIEGQGSDTTPLTEANRSAGRNGVRVKPKREVKQELAIPRTGRVCGIILERQDSDHCADCMPEELRSSAMAFREARRVKLKALRAAGEDPAHIEAAMRRRGEKVARAQREFRHWNAALGGEADLQVFRRDDSAGAA